MRPSKKSTAGNLCFREVQIPSGVCSGYELDYLIDEEILILPLMLFQL